MTDLDRDIAEVEATLKHLKKLLKAQRMTGRKHSDATRAKMSAASKAAWADPAVRAKMSAASKAALADPAVRAKMSAARKAAWADPAVRAKMSAARKAALADPAVRAKMSAASKAALAEKYEQDMRPKQRRETRKCLPPVPRDPYEAMLFGGGRR